MCIRDSLVNGADVDDAAAAALLDHLLRCELRPKERALEIDRKHSVILRLGRIQDGLSLIHI